MIFNIQSNNNHTDGRNIVKDLAEGINNIFPTEGNNDAAPTEEVNDSNAASVTEHDNNSNKRKRINFDEATDEDINSKFARFEAKPFNKNIWSLDDNMALYIFKNMETIPP